MGYDIRLAISTGKSLHTVYENDYTYNVSPMYYKAFATNDGLNSLNGLRAKFAINFLDSAIAYMTNYKQEYITLNPANGWGDYEGALQVLVELKQACEDHPTCTVYIH